MAEQKLVKTHVYNFEPKDNGGESLTLTTTYYDNKYGEYCTNQKLTLQSYCNSASFELSGTQLTPDKLRELANQLEKNQIEVHFQLKQGLIE